MKRTIRLFAIIALMIASVNAFAQKPFAGKITYELSAEGITDPNIAAQLAEQTMEYTVMGNCCRMDMNVGIDMTTIENGNSKTFTIILGIPGYGKYYIQTTEEEIQKKLATTKMDYNYTGEEKTITGYKCQKVILTETDLETDEEKVTVLWVTNELGLGDNINFYKHAGLKGYPLCTEQTQEINGENVTVITTATKIVPDKKLKPTFVLLPSDAKPFEEAPEELKQMLGGLADDDEEE